jgi:Endoplasmic reticulum-based factor for assembly of V-ATPase
MLWISLQDEGQTFMQQLAISLSQISAIPNSSKKSHILLIQDACAMHLLVESGTCLPFDSRKIYSNKLKNEATNTSSLLISPFFKPFLTVSNRPSSQLPKAKRKKAKYGKKKPYRERRHHYNTKHSTSISFIVPVSFLNDAYAFYEKYTDHLLEMNPNLERKSLASIMRRFQVINDVKDEDSFADYKGSQTYTDSFLSPFSLSQNKSYNRLVKGNQGSSYSHQYALTSIEKHQLSAIINVLFSVIGVGVAITWILLYQYQYPLINSVLVALAASVVVLIAEASLYYRLFMS